MGNPAGPGVWSGAQANLRESASNHNGSQPQLCEVSSCFVEQGSRSTSRSAISIILSQPCSPEPARQEPTRRCSRPRVVTPHCKGHPGSEGRDSKSLTKTPPRASVPVYNWCGSACLEEGCLVTHTDCISLCVRTLM